MAIRVGDVIWAALRVQQITPKAILAIAQGPGGAPITVPLDPAQDLVPPDRKPEPEPPTQSA